MQNSPEKKAELAALKTTLQDRVTAMDAVASNRLPDDIRELITIISTGDPITESELRMSPLRVEQKIADKLLLRKVKGYVIDGMYEMVNEAIEQLAASNRLNVRQFERSIKLHGIIRNESIIFQSIWPLQERSMRIIWLPSEAGQKGKSQPRKNIPLKLIKTSIRNIAYKCVFYPGRKRKHDGI